MNLNECYKNLGGDFDAVLGRLRSEKMIEKFIFKFLDDRSFSELSSALASKNVQEAFRAAHTLKGVCQNLSFTLLGASAEQITETLRAGELERAFEFFKMLSEDYDKTANAINEYRASLQVETAGQ